MRWHVFKLDDPETWPKYDCPIAVCKSIDDWPEMFWWNKGNRTFENDYKEVKFSKCFYVYFTYLPYIEKECHVTKCGYYKENCPYGHDDDGYCMCDEDFECEYKKAKTEYALGLKRIWKRI